MPNPTAERPTPALTRYLAARRRLETAAWVTFWLVQAAANTVTAGLDQARLADGAAWWEVATWEFSSNLVALALVPGVVWVLDRWPLAWGLLVRHARVHALASVAFSVLHVAAMVALRKAVYATQGLQYRFGPWPRGFIYELLKDVRTYALIVAAVLAYRLLLWRWQGEARWLAAPDEGAAAAVPAAAEPERFLVKKLGKEFLLPTAEIEWVQACGNYVNLHRGQHDYPLRSTLAAIEKRLDAARFVRVHRSYLVNLDGVEAIAPTEAGDAVIQMKGGGRLPCSRTHLEALRRRLSGTAA